MFTTNVYKLCHQWTKALKLNSSVSVCLQSFSILSALFSYQICAPTFRNIVFICRCYVFASIFSCSYFIFTLINCFDMHIAYIRTNKFQYWWSSLWKYKNLVDKQIKLTRFVICKFIFCCDIDDFSDPTFWPFSHGKLAYEEFVARAEIDGIVVEMQHAVICTQNCWIAAFRDRRVMERKKLSITSSQCIAR